jgi:hypothetical protein
MRTRQEIWPILLASGGIVAFLPLFMIDPLLVIAVPVAAGFLACIVRPNIGIYALVLLLFFAPVTINAGWPGQTTTYVFLAALILAIGGRISRFVTKQQSVNEASWILLLLLPVALSGILHETSLKDFWAYGKSLIVLVVVAWHVTAEARLAPERLRRVAVIIAWFAIPLFVLAAYQRATGSWPVLDQFAVAKSYTSRGDPTRTAAIMGHSILYGGYCMVAATISATLKPRHWKWLFAASLAGLVLSGARSAWLGMAVIFILLLVIYRPKVTFLRSYGLLLLTCGVLFAMIAAPQAVDDITGTAWGRIDNVTESVSALARQLRVNMAWVQITDNESTWTWGLGPGALVAYFTVVTISDSLAATFDNSYLTLWYEYGVIPVVILSVALLVGIFRNGPTVGRLLLLGITIQIWFFDFYQWPLMIGAISLAAGLRQQEKLPARQDDDVLLSRQRVIKQGRTRSASTLEPFRRSSTAARAGLRWRSL